MNSLNTEPEQVLLIVNLAAYRSSMSHGVLVFTSLQLQWSFSLSILHAVPCFFGPMIVLLFFPSLAIHVYVTSFLKTLYTTNNVIQNIMNLHL